MLFCIAPPIYLYKRIPTRRKKWNRNEMELIEKKRTSFSPKQPIPNCNISFFYSSFFLFCSFHMHPICNLHSSLNTKSELNKSETVHKICSMLHLTIDLVNEYEYIYVIIHPIFIAHAHAQHTGTSTRTHHTHTHTISWMNQRSPQNVLSITDPPCTLYRYYRDVSLAKFNPNFMFHSFVRSFFLSCVFLLIV